MNDSRIDVINQRLRNQNLARSAFQKPGEIVAWLGAIQAQDYPAAKWAIGLRAPDIVDDDVERAFNEGRILRTHCLRPTWHFVSPADIRWMLGLSGPRVNAVNAYYYRKFELDTGTFARSRRVLERTLRGGTQLTRAELASVFRRARMPAEGFRLVYLLMRAELDAVICSGPRRGKQFTYALMEDRVPPAPRLDRDQALAALTQRYYSSRGPATLRDFVWWSGLTVRQARAGVEAIKSDLEETVIEGKTRWFVPSGAAGRLASRSVYLLPNYDEFGIAYKDRDIVPSVSRPQRLAARDEFAHLLLIDGRLTGRWRRTLTTSRVVIDAQPFRPLTTSERRGLDASAEEYGRFLNMPVTVSLV